MTQFLRLITVALIAITTVIPAFAADGKSCDQHLTDTSAAANPNKAARRTAFASIMVFQNYMNGLKKRLLEREYLIDIAGLALLSEEHLLLMGPPGNAKSMFADTILGNITEADGQQSYFRLQMTPETTLSETHGPLDFKTLNETGRYVRLLEEGMLQSRNVFVDEIFDARANAQRNILGMLNERAHAQGVHITPGKIETAFAATNKYISEVYEKAGDDSPKAVLDRFAFSAFVPGEFAFTESYVSLIQGAKKGSAKVPPISFDDLENLRGLVSKVEIPDGVAKFLALLSTRMKEETEALEQSSIKNYKERLKNGEEPGIPYRSTKYHSPRTLGKAAGVLKSIVVLDWINRGGKRRLEANLDDVHKLMTFFTLNGPSNSFINNIIERTSSPHERAQLMAIIQEREIFEKYYVSLLDEVNQVLVHFALHDLQAEIDEAKTEKQKSELSKKLLSLMISLDDEVDQDALHSTKTGKDIGVDLIREEYKKMLITVLGGEDKAGSVIDRIENERREMVAQRVREAEARRQEEINKQRVEAARVAAAKAREEAERRRIEEEQAKILAALNNKTSVFSQPITLSNIQFMKYAYHAESQTLVMVENGQTVAKVLNLDEAKGISGRNIGLNLPTLLNGEQLDKIEFVDQDRILLFDDKGASAVVVDINSGATEEILLSRVQTRTAFYPATQMIYTIDGQGQLTSGSLSGGSRKKAALTFKDSTIHNAFTNSITNRGVLGGLEVSADGKYLTMISQYLSYEFVVDIAANQVISHEQLFPTDQNFQPVPGTMGLISSSLIVTDRSSNIVKFKKIENSSGRLQNNYGLAWLPAVEVGLVGSQSGLYIWESKTSTVTEASATGANLRSHSAIPIVLPDGRIVVLTYTNQWHITVLK